MYSPTLGRWMQQDPAGYVDGMNLQQYERSNPPVHTDPLGLNVSYPGEVGYAKIINRSTHSLLIYGDWVELVDLLDRNIIYYPPTRAMERLLQRIHPTLDRGEDGGFADLQPTEDSSSSDFHDRTHVVDADYLVWALGASKIYDDDGVCGCADDKVSRVLGGWDTNSGWIFRLLGQPADSQQAYKLNGKSGKTTYEVYDCPSSSMDPRGVYIKRIVD